MIFNQKWILIRRILINYGEKDHNVTDCKITTSFMPKLIPHDGECVQINYTLNDGPESN